MAMTFPVGSHNLKLRYWLAAGGINPGFYAPPQDTSGQINAEALLSVTPPPQMPATLESVPFMDTASENLGTNKLCLKTSAYR
jgi:nitrate/nitrite transport system substrate-binding protein